jgi:hypothetical protein
MKQTTKLTPRTKGMMAGQAAEFGQYLDGNMGQVSGAGPYAVPGITRGEAIPSEYSYNTWPYVVSGMTDFDPSSLLPGANIHSVQFGAFAKAKRAGFDEAVQTGASVGGTAAY